MVRIYASYPFSLYSKEYDKMIRDLGKKHKLKATGSGAGFGQRDLDFVGAKKNAEAFIKSLSKNKNIKVAIYEDD